jgi:outer membrane lipoprotein-sorting protein
MRIAPCIIAALVLLPAASAWTAGPAPAAAPAVRPAAEKAASEKAGWSAVNSATVSTARSVAVNTGVLDYEAATILNRVREAYRMVGSLTAKFIQTETRTGVSRTDIVAGTLSFRPPDKMLWDYQGKPPHRFVVNGDLVWIHTPARKQVVKKKMTLEEMRTGGATFLRGLEGVEQQFDLASRGTDSAGRALLQLIPRGETPYERIEVTVNQLGLLDAIRIRHKIGNVTTIAFTDIKTGVDLPGRLFAFDVPDGTEVVEP